MTLADLMLAEYPAPARVTIAAVIAATARQFNISPFMLVVADGTLFSPRKPEFVRPRQVAMYLARDLTKASFADIGHRFGGRDHSTAIHAHRLIPALCDDDAELAGHVAAIRRELGQ